MTLAVRVVLLRNEGCPASAKTAELIRECLADLTIEADLREVLVRTQDEADAWRFLGSPTIQVNGVDIEPAARDRRRFGFF